MSDATLFAVGCGVVLLSLGGAYTFVRERYLDGTRREADRAPGEKLDPVALARDSA